MIQEFLTVLGSILAIGGLVLWLVLRYERRATVRVFMKMFPGRCMICSYHAHGVREGHISGQVESHYCIEKAPNGS